MEPDIPRDWTDKLANCVRPLTTFVAIGVFAWMAIVGKLSTEATMSTISTIVTFWYLQRQQAATTAATTAAVKAAANGNGNAKSPPIATG